MSPFGSKERQLRANLTEQVKLSLAALDQEENKDKEPLYVSTTRIVHRVLRASRQGYC